MILMIGIHCHTHDQINFESFLFRLMNPRPSFVLFGDSITQQSFSLSCGWALPIADAYATSVDVMNRGFSGYNSRWAAAVAKNVITTRLFSQLELVTVFFGANDCVSPGLPGDWSRQHVPVDEYEANLRRIVTHVQNLENRDRSAPRVILIAPPPVDEEAWLRRTVEKWAGVNGLRAEDIPCNRRLDSVKAYAAAAQRVAAATNVPFIDLCNDMLASSSDWKAYLSDGLHLNASGAAFLAAKLQHVIENEFSGALRVGFTPPQLPVHTDLTAENWEEKLRAIVPGSWLK
jgi:isoamyl acetate esterase